MTEKHQCCSVLLSKNAGLQSCSLNEKPLQDRCFPVNIAKILRTPVLKNICEPLFEHFATWANNIQATGSEEEIFNELDEKNLSLHDAFINFVVFYFSTACLRWRLPYIIKDNSSEGLQNSLTSERLILDHRKN